MNIWNKVLVGLILLMSIVFFILGARALKTHQFWRERAVEQQEALAAAAEEEEGLLERVGQLSLELHEQLVDRGRVWYRCRPQGQPRDTGEVGVVAGIPVPHRIETQTVLWVFDEFDVRNGGNYLGQFTVTAVGGQDNRQLQLTPAVRLTGQEAQRLQQSAARNGVTWVLYETMPADKHEALAGLSEDELRAMLPETSVEEYVMDGQPTTLAEAKRRGLRGKVFQVDQSGEIVRENGIPKEVVAENEQGKFVRQLRDYEELFRQYQLGRSAWIDKRATTLRNRDYIKGADTDLRLQVQHRQNDRDQLVADRQKSFSDRDLAADRLEEMKARLDSVRSDILETINKNQEFAGEIARIQREATRLIDERIRTMAQVGPGK